MYTHNICETVVGNNMCVRFVGRGSRFQPKKSFSLLSTVVQRDDFRCNVNESRQDVKIKIITLYYINTQKEII